MRHWIRALAAAAIAGGLVSAAAALTITPLDEKTVSVDIATSGVSRDAAMAEARVQAVLSTAGRVLIDGQLLRADDLLDKYLRNYAPQFVTALEVYEEEFTGGKNVLSSRVFVDYEALVKDLTEKKFIYSPSYKPMFAVFMQEALEGSELSQEVARPLLQNALEVVGLKAYGGLISTPPMTVDVSTDSDLLSDALKASERRNVELLVTGSTVTRLREEKKVYYDTFYFYDCEMTAQLVRVDTGEVLETVTAKGSASDRDRAESIRLAIERAAQSVATGLDEKYQSFWPRVVQSGSDYEILLTGANDELIRIISQHLGRVSIDAEISVKKTFDTTAVLTVSSSAARDSILEALRGCPYPALTIIREIGRKKFEVQVAG